MGTKNRTFLSRTNKNPPMDGRFSGVDKLTQLVAPSKEEAFEVQLWSGRMVG